MLLRNERRLFTGSIGSVLRHFQMRPYGARLLTSGAGFWLFAARLSIFLMATVEAIAWSYLGYLFLEGRARWISAALVGFVIFLVVWMIDASLLTIDRSYSDHARKILGEPARTHWLSMTAAVGVRAAIVILSLTVTAPYLSQLIFHKEIVAAVNQEAVAALDPSSTVTGRNRLRRKS